MPSKSPPKPIASQQLAERIRDLRVQRNWTLNVTAERTGVSRSALSKIERHEMSPTFNALQKLARGFEVGMNQLLEGTQAVQPSSAIVTRRAEGSFHETSRYRLRLLNAEIHANPSLLAVEFIVDARDISEFAEWDRHDDENLVYVIEGPIAFHHEGNEGPIVLDTGDSVMFDARVGHAFVSLGPTPGRALSVTIRL
jgi:transcriptional regulator with XRE-family HTH domain